MKKSQMIPDDEKSGYAKTSLSMTRSIAEDIGMKIRDVLDKITDNEIDLTYVQWKEYVTNCWHDKLQMKAINIAITKAEKHKINLNKNEKFLQLIQEKSFPELKMEMESTHPIAKMSIKDNIGKEKPKPAPKHQYKDVWLTPEERQRIYSKQE